MSSAIHPATWRSSWIGACQRPPRLALRPAASISATAPTTVPAPWTQPMKRGCRLPTAKGATSARKSAWMSASGAGASGRPPARLAGSSPGGACQTGRALTPATWSRMSSSMACAWARKAGQSSGSRSVSDGKSEGMAQPLIARCHEPEARHSSGGHGANFRFATPEAETSRAGRQGGREVRLPHDQPCARPLRAPPRRRACCPRWPRPKLLASCERAAL